MYLRNSLDSGLEFFTSMSCVNPCFFPFCLRFWPSWSPGTWRLWVPWRWCATAWAQVRWFCSTASCRSVCEEEWIVCRLLGHSPDTQLLLIAFLLCIWCWVCAVSPGSSSFLLISVHRLSSLTFSRVDKGLVCVCLLADCYVADELIVSRAGRRVRVGNTDAEGRMVMVDLLCEMKEKVHTRAHSSRWIPCFKIL